MAVISEGEWLEVRRHLERHRFVLGVEAAGEFGDHPRVFGTPLLTTPRWMPAAPIDLTRIELSLAERDFERSSSREYGAVLPAGAGDDYTDVYRRLAAPRVFENRGTYRLLGADLTGPPGRLEFGLGRYFDSLNTGEASAHAFAAQRLGRESGTIREYFRDPCDAAVRPVNFAVSALTLRRDARTGAAEFYLHWRDPAKVGHAGGLFQVVPSGVFQASGAGEGSLRNDFSLLRFLIRECAEELAGRPERQDVDYTAWPFARDFQASGVRAWCVGLGVDPLTFATDLLAVLVFDADAFDALFGTVVSENDEGRVLAATPFVEPEIARLVEREPMQAAGAALLAAAWHHRSVLLR